MKKHLVILCICLIGHVALRADLRDDILSNAFCPRTLSAWQQDSILNGVPDGRYQLVKQNEKGLFRHSKMADYFLYDTQKQDSLPISDGPVRDAVMSPNGKYVVYAKADNNLYIYKVDFRTEVAITQDPIYIYNGIADWLYEEEFGHTCQFAFSPDSKMVAFIRLNEQDVPRFTYQRVLRDIAPGEGVSYPVTDSLRYPRAGEKNASAQVCLYDIHYKSIRSISLPRQENTYIPRLVWGVMKEPKGKEEPVPASVYVLQINRDQNAIWVYSCNPKSLVPNLFYEEKSDSYYVDYQLFDQWQFLENGKVIVVSEKDGYIRAYLYASNGAEEKCLTPQNRDVTAVYGWDAATQMLYYQAAPRPEDRCVYQTNIKKEQTICLSTDKGINSATFSRDWKQYILCHESATEPNRYTLCTVGKNQEQTLLSNDSIQQQWDAYGLNNKEFFVFRTERGDSVHGWRLLPKDFSAQRKYPVVMMQYSGPGSQRVLNQWKKRFGAALSDAGYVVVCVDGRGTGARGRVWKNASYMQLGRVEAEDQMSAAKYIGTWPWVDAHRIALCGWSYGGFETLMCMSLQDKQHPLWKCGIAIAPVTDWRLYDSAYTERYMRRPEVNEDGYIKASAIDLAPNLTGRLLLVHGLGDDNVHAQHSLLYADALVKAGIQFDMQLYPDDNHFLKAGNNYTHLHERIMDFLKMYNN